MFIHISTNKLSACEVQRTSCIIDTQYAIIDMYCMRLQLVVRKCYIHGCRQQYNILQDTDIDNIPRARHTPYAYTITIQHGVLASTFPEQNNIILNRYYKIKTVCDRKVLLSVGSLITWYYAIYMSLHSRHLSQCKLHHVYIQRKGYMRYRCSEAVTYSIRTTGTAPLIWYTLPTCDHDVRGYLPMLYVCFVYDKYTGFNFPWTDSTPGPECTQNG